ncbi:MAG TPA: PAS domain S-box protein [Blastocatellia bacterium]|nr:PAS domain S-box protein [Blastocatellia bacterium]
MYLLKSDLPPTVLVYLSELNLKSQSPAWMMLGEDLTLKQYGGNLAYYGIDGLKPGVDAAEQLRFLTGLLPVDDEPVELPCVETDSGIYADIHIWLAFGFTWVLLVDTTTHALEYRRMQQRGNELSLLNQQQARTLTHEFVNELFTGLEVVALEALADGSLNLVSRLPDWFAQIWPEAVAGLSRTSLGERFPFLANFLVDAEEFWQGRKPGRLKSGLWIDLNTAGSECQLEASAICLRQTRLLLIESGSLADQEMQAILQKARETILSYHRLTRTEAALRRSEERNKALLEALPDVMVLTDHQGNLTDYKARPGHKWHAPENFQQYNLTELLDPEIAALARQHMQQARQTGEIQVYEYQTRINGEPEPVAFEARVVRCGERELLSIIRDVTERRRVEEAELVQRSEEYFRSLIENSSDIIVVVNADATVRYETPSMKRILGHDPAERIGRSAFDLIHPDDQAEAREYFRRVLEQRATDPAENVVEIEVRVRHRNGGWRWVGGIVKNLLDVPQIAGLVLTFHDITERRLAEAEKARLQASLHRSETLAAMGSLVAGVAHEVRNPLFSISATLDAFEARHGQKGDHQQYVSVLRGEVDRLSKLMQDLLQYGKHAAPELTETSLNEVVSQALESCQALAQQAGCRVTSQIAEDFRLMADREQLQQVFQNLIDNALRHSPSGGTVVVSAAAFDHAGEPWLSCSVRDNGPGFPAEFIDKVFEPFFSRRRGGTGLGLSIVQRIIEGHGGEVTAANPSEGGAVVTVKLPVRKQS